MRFPLLLLATFDAILRAGPALAASFDCAKAMSPMEQAVCSDQKLSSADEVMSKAYGAAIAKVSPEAYRRLLDSQRSWLAYAAARCRPGGVPLDLWRWDRVGLQTHVEAGASSRCLEDVYNDRVQSLKKAVIRLGSRSFVSTTTYQVHPQLEDTRGNDPDAVIEQATLLQIDKPTTTERVWNAKVVQRYVNTVDHPDPAGNGTFNEIDDDIDISIRLVSSSPTFIDAIFEYDFYAKGTPHGYGSPAAKLWSLKLNRLLDAEDIFDKNKPWKNALALRVYNALSPEWKTHEYRVLLPSLIEDSSRWSFKNSGLEIVFNAYDFNMHPTPQPISIPWIELQPFFVKHLPFDLKAIQVPP